MPNQFIFFHKDKLTGRLPLDDKLTIHDIERLAKKNKIVFDRFALNYPAAGHDYCGHGKYLNQPDKWVIFDWEGKEVINPLKTK